MEARGGRAPRTDHEILAVLAQLDLPRLWDGDISGSPYFVQRVLQVRRNAFALCRACHLQSHKLLDDRFLACYTQKVNPKLNLRRVTIKEALEADRKIMGSVYALASETGWLVFGRCAVRVCDCPVRCSDFVAASSTWCTRSGWQGHRSELRWSRSEQRQLDIKRVQARPLLEFVHFCAPTSPAKFLPTAACQRWTTVMY